MTFAALRQTVLQGHALSLDRFAENVELTDGGATRTVRAKITHEGAGPRAGRKTVVSGGERGTFTERERIEVYVSRLPTWEFALPLRPQPAATLRRDAARDADRRPYAFAGEVIYEGDQDATYVFERPRRTVQGRDA